MPRSKAFLLAQASGSTGLLRDMPMLVVDPEFLLDFDRLWPSIMEPDVSCGGFMWIFDWEFEGSLFIEASFDGFIEWLRLSIILSVEWRRLSGVMISAPGSWSLIRFWLVLYYCSQFFFFSNHCVQLLFLIWNFFRRRTASEPFSATGKFSSRSNNAF